MAASYNQSLWANITVEEFIRLLRGPKRIPLAIVIPITIIYSAMFISGVVGNLLVCLVIYRNPSMHTTTNYYLFSLAISDLTLLVLGLPNDLSLFWKQYPWTFGVSFCKLRALMSEMSSYTSVLTIVAFSVERYLAICHPLQAYIMSGINRVVKIVVLLWVVSLISAIPFAVFTTVNYLDFPPGSGNIVHESAFCAMLDNNIPSWWPIYEISTLIYFVLPMILILLLYVKIGLTLHSHANGTELNSVSRDSRSTASKKSINRMLMTVVAAFFLCWAPFHAQRLLYIYARDSPNYLEINEWMYYITGVFYYFSSTVNPILYNLMSTKYRQAFKQTLCGGFSLSPDVLLPAYGLSTYYTQVDKLQVASNSCVPT